MCNKISTIYKNPNACILLKSRGWVKKRKPIMSTTIKRKIDCTGDGPSNGDPLINREEDVVACKRSSKVSTFSQFHRIVYVYLFSCFDFIVITVIFVGIGADRDGGWENWSSRGACTTNHDLFINGRFVELLQSLPTMESLLTERTGITLWTTYVPS